MICEYKATIPGSKIFMREYEIDTDISLYALHRFLSSDLEFDPDQIVEFRGVKDNGSMGKEYSVFDFGHGSLDTVSVSATLSAGEHTLLYVYDIRQNRYITLSFEKEAELNPRASYPRLVAERGRNPEQFGKSYEDLEKFDGLSGISDEK
ncbi:MAG: plasmid pRiA4b ORF-3 family protein [Bacteroidales bacterium]|jgi:hypothetical protein|nr:plasmid pRiA4b ORF-3 family protein [Bacteroidales bacterium]